MGFLVRAKARFSFTFSLKKSLTILSSSEWKLMMTKRPLEGRISKALGKVSLRVFSSSFTAMRKAWKTRVAGWVLFLEELGLMEVMIWASWLVEVMGDGFLTSTIFLAIRLAKRSCPYFQKRMESSFSDRPLTRSLADTEEF